MRRTLAQERLQFQEEQSRILKRQAEARETFEGLRREALDLLRQMPEPALQSSDSLHRLSEVREALRSAVTGTPWRPDPPASLAPPATLAPPPQPAPRA